LEYWCEVKYTQTGGSIDDAGYFIQRTDEAAVL
jgi:hypothetical protein